MRSGLLARLCVPFIVAVVAVLVPAQTAAAHPFGPPSTARIAVDGDRVTLAWLPAEDDWVALGQSLGAFEDPATGADTTLTGEQKLARSAAVRDYLLAHVGVTQGGRPCAAELEPLERLLAEGARFGFECPEPVVTVDVRIAALTDLHQAYRTVLTSDTPAEPAKVLFTKAEDTRSVRFDAPEGGGVPLAVPAVALVAVLGVLVLLLVRRRAPAPPAASDKPAEPAATPGTGE